MSRIRRQRGQSTALPVLFARVKPANKAKVDVTADALNLSAAQIADAVLDRVEVDRTGLIVWAHELTGTPRRPRGESSQLPVLFARVQDDNKAKIDVTADALNLSAAQVADAVLERVPTDGQGVIVWAYELVDATEHDLLTELDQLEESNLLRAS
ncbi:hypothetical protein AB0H36_27595 [Kribbella sp. NPDC050820]|uniref:hypothetical protein n=1 Tax=Kribbella sp. NPDC050820 TaxID=3155408 RepID=UPI0033F5E8A8